MTSDTDRRAAIRALVMEHAEADASPARPPVVRRARLITAVAVAVTAAVGVGSVLIVGLGIPSTPDAAPAPGPAATASTGASGSTGFQYANPGSSPASPETIPGDSAASATDASALGLVGLWTIAGSDGTGNDAGAHSDAGAYSGTDTPMRIDGYSLTLYPSCGQIFWDFAAAGGLLALGRPGGSQDCFVAGDGSFVPPSIDWADSLRGYRAVADGWDLLDSTGTVQVRLRPFAGATSDVLPADPSAEPQIVAPVIDDQVRAALAPSQPLPTSVTAATAKDILGTWEVVGDDPPGGEDSATITFRREDYVVSDCHSRISGVDATTAPGTSWTGSGDLFLSPPTSSDAMHCAPSLSVSPSQIRSIAISGGRLVLFDRDAREIARLERPTS